MGTASLNDRVLAKGAADGCPDRLAAVDHEQPGLLGVQAPVDEVGKQRVAHGLILGAALPQTQRLFAALGVHAQSNHDTVVGNQDAVDEDGQQVELAEVAAEQFDQLLLGALDKAPRDG